MKNHRAMLLCSMVLCALTWALGVRADEAARDNRHNQVSISSLASLPAGGGQGVSGIFSGRVGNSVLVAGGCNFPDVPAAEGGAKKFYNSVYVLENPLEEESAWKEIGYLTDVVAYGASVTTPEGVVCIGGSNGSSVKSSVFMLSIVKGELNVTEMPSLPIALEHLCAAYGDGYIYVAGGRNDKGGSYAAYRLAYPSGTQWEQLPDLPGTPRLQSVGVVQKAATGSCFYVFGGYCDPIGQTAGVVHLDGVKYDIQKGEWNEVAPIAPHGKEMTLVGAAGVVSGCSHIVCMGGVDATIFEEAINRQVYISKIGRAHV